MDSRRLLETGAATTVFAVIFLFGGRLYPMRALLRSRRNALSFSAGMAIAYVFVHVTPELNGARDTFLKFTYLPTIFQGMFVYFFAMLGFLFFYSLDQLTKRSRLTASAGGGEADFDLKLIGFAGYVCLIAYLLVNNLDVSLVSSGAYAVAMGAHFLTLDHGFREGAPGVAYARRGHLLLAGAALLGWGLGLAFALPRGALALMLGFLSGGIIVNTAILELPTGDEKMWPFITGAISYGVLLMMLR